MYVMNEGFQRAAMGYGGDAYGRGRMQEAMLKQSFSRTLRDIVNAVCGDILFDITSSYGASRRMPQPPYKPEDAAVRIAILLGGMKALFRYTRDSDFLYYERNDPDAPLLRKCQVIVRDIFGDIIELANATAPESWRLGERAGCGRGTHYTRGRMQEAVLKQSFPQTLKDIMNNVCREVFSAVYDFESVFDRSYYKPADAAIRIASVLGATKALFQYTSDKDFLCYHDRNDPDVPLLKKCQTVMKNAYDGMLQLANAIAPEGWR